jgi:nicotinate phosphoribosyltransferase
MAIIYLTFEDQINISFGIGTNLTNDMGVRPLQIVIKMIECNGQPVCKISDSSGKGMCEDDDYLKYVKKVFKVEG